MKSKEWLDRQNRDFYVKKAKKIGYVSRSAYKILEIEKKFKLINNSKNILELGSAPGGWSQVIFELKDTVKMYAFDLLDMKFKHPNMKFIKENFLTYDYSKIPHKFDLILSDIAPNTTGHQTTDHLRMSSIIEDIISVLDLIALPSSSFVFKIWKGSEEIDIINKLKKKYKKVSYFKPQSSRTKSSEIFIVAQKFIH
ncbi:MAG: Ribosomal RNA large subunit methyltransferase E [Alphaproteobacteria bacterium MarineAlpha5_Bin2]|jgi:23S rRNA (uridine2552-2'-O)-methyltransferase|nr:MAG: Ribosomal RNA large subunit methyltransferase E [Alphaproteobacteria bacterium MarineAlpha5_Bin2]HIA60391.1 RlmE family RNA methyltransferase [Pelagibacterales bacterium]|tara:strand:+ start:5456 stop:6046 length:591 start_codon:yes stop_codon:yes gene_type:complete